MPRDQHMLSAGHEDQNVISMEGVGLANKYEHNKVNPEGIKLLIKALNLFLLLVISFYVKLGL